MFDIYVIAGPTASGKTELAVALATCMGGEVVSADSMQVYKGMDIGTAKPTKEERKGIPHHMIDICQPNEPFSAALYKSLAKKAVDGILQRGKIPVIAGGTGFYINALIYDTEFQEIDEHEFGRLRESFCLEAREKGAAFLHSRLLEVDRESAKAVHENNVRRVSKALAYFCLTGTPFSVHNSLQKQRKLCFNTGFFLLEFPRDVLYGRIDIRTEKMFENGLVQEVEGLIKNGFGTELMPMNGIGYKEAALYLGGHIGYGDAIGQTMNSTRNYAKRQETWFRNQSPNAKVIHAFNKSSNEMVEEILCFTTI